MPSYGRKKFTLPLVIISAVLMLVVMIFFYNIYVSDTIDEFSEQNLEQLVSNSADTVQLKLASDLSLLESSAELLPVWDYLRYINFKDENFKYLSRSFDYMMVVNPYGYAVGSDSNIGDVARYAYFEEAIRGETVIYGPLLSEFSEQAAIIMSTPMVAHSETRGVLVGFVYLDTLGNMFGKPINGLVANLIVDAEGNIIANGVKDSDFTPLSNAYSIMSNHNLIPSEEFEEFKRNIANNVHGKSKINFRNEVHNVIYKPIGIKNWMVVSIMPETIIQATTNELVVITGFISVLIMVVVTIFATMINFSQKRTLEKIAEIAYVSPVTGISTLVKFKLDAKNFVMTHGGKKFLLVKFDVENFRLLNESLGTKAGDKILKLMAQAISCNDAERCICAHIHSDEFLVMVAYTDEDITTWRDDYEEMLLALLGSDFNYSIRIVAGCYRMSANEKIDISVAIERANIAHRYAKETKSDLSFYSQEFLEDAIKTKDIENRMEEALQNGEFQMYLQPEFSLQKNMLVGCEALVRWRSDDSLIPPDEFIPVFERNGFILKLDFYMFEQACKYLRAWFDAGRTPMTISVNFSRKHLYSNDFIPNLIKICEKYSLATKYLGIEVTESTMLSNDGDLIQFIRKLQEKGFKVFMDDFGAGYSSLGLLKNIPVDVLKLDKSFFDNMENRERSIVVVKSVVQLSKGLNIKTIAEGVETLEDAIILKDMGCDIIQGYYYSKPLHNEEFTSFCDSDKSKIDLA